MNQGSLAFTIAAVCLSLAALAGCEPKPKEPKASAIAPVLVQTT